MRSARAWLVTIATLACAASGCAPASATLVVDLRTDLLPAVEFTAVRTTLRAGGTTQGSASPAFAADDFVGGQRVAEIEGLAPGDYDLDTELLDSSRGVVVSRTTHLSVRATLALTVVLSRDCRGHVCPAPAGEQSLKTCRQGVCVDPRCSSVDATFCPSGCTSDAQCSVSTPCASARCVEGTCLAVAGDHCAANERCDPEIGCVPTTVSCVAPLRECSTICTNIQGDPLHCGDCTTVCPAPAHARADCAAGVCGYVCDPGFFHCGAACSPDPCVTSVTAAGMTTFEVPVGCTRLGVVAWGAGGGGAPSGGGLRPGSAGGLASALLAVQPGDVLTIVVGEAGAAGTAVGGNGFGGAGGMPGGGRGSDAGQHGGGGGGGYTGVFSGAPSQASALVIAGAGGGAGGAGYNDGAGGGYTGALVAGGSTGAPGTQTAGGIGTGGAGSGGALMGGAGARDSDGGGGGGAGWYGGAGSHGASSNASGGGGGSGYVTPMAVTYALATGLAGTPPSDADPRRGMAGGPGQPGAVLLSCE